MESFNKQSSSLAELERPPTNVGENGTDEPTDDEGHDDSDDQRDVENDNGIEPEEVKYENRLQMDGNVPFLVIHQTVLSIK